MAYKWTVSLGKENNIQRHEQYWVYWTVLLELMFIFKVQGTNKNYTWQN